MPTSSSDAGPGGAALPFRATAAGLRVQLKVTPKAAADRVGGFARDAGGGLALKVAVTAAADKGKANAAVVRLLAKEWGLAKSDLEIVQGASARNKSLLIRGDGAVLMRRLTAWCRDRGLETE